MREEESRGEEGEQNDGDEDHEAVEHDEGRLVLHDGASPATSHLGDTVGTISILYQRPRIIRVANSPVDASDQDTCKGSGDGVCEPPELLVEPQCLGLRGDLIRVNPLPHPDEVVHAGNAEAGQNHNLQTDARDDGPVAAVKKLLIRVAGTGSKCAADGLDEQTRHVGGDEDEWVQVRPDARHGRVETDGYMLERQVDGDADERGGQDDGANLRFEGILVPRVVVQ